jgi:hypothetical protein
MKKRKKPESRLGLDLGLATLPLCAAVAAAARALPTGSGRQIWCSPHRIRQCWRCSAFLSSPYSSLPRTTARSTPLGSKDREPPLDPWPVRKGRHHHNGKPASRYCCCPECPAVFRSPLAEPLCHPPIGVAPMHRRAIIAALCAPPWPARCQYGPLVPETGGEGWGTVARLAEEAHRVEREE